VLKVAEQRTIGAASRPAAVRFSHRNRESVKLVEELRMASYALG
jgi:hypothetical protein